MTWPEYCIKRPVFTIVVSLMLVILGLIHFHKLAIRYLPNIDKPIVNIATDYDGANPELIEKEITIPIENIISSISGIDTIRSTSALGKSRININFQLGVDINDAISDIRNKLSVITKKLPKDSHPPIVSKNDSESHPVLILGFHDRHKTPLEITDYISRFIKPSLQEIKGVGEVVFHGSRNYAVKIVLDPVKMAAYNLTVADIKHALNQQNIDVPSGQIRSHHRFYTVITKTRLKAASHFKDIVIAQRHKQTIRLSEVAKIKVESENKDSLLRINGKPAVGVAILSQSTANPVEVANAVKKTLARLKATLPKEFEVHIVFDSTIFIQQSISEVCKSFIEAILFVSIIVFLFLGNISLATIPIITIPLCITGVFWPLYLCGFDLNIITLLALVLAIGLVVDDAIVVLENCHRHLNHNLIPQQAAINGSNQIIFVILAMTVTLTAVYAPMAFIQGFTGKLFLQFGITLALCVLISGFIALTLSPMMCAKLLHSAHNNKSKYRQWLNSKFVQIEQLYLTSLKLTLNHPLKLGIIITIFTILGFYCYLRLGAELAPAEDQGYIIGILASPTNSSTTYTDHYTRELENIYQNVPEKTMYLSSIKPNSAFTILKLKPWDERRRKQQEINYELREKMQDITGVNAYPISANPLGQTGNSQFSFVILGNTSYTRLNEISHHIIKILDKNPDLSHIKNSLALDSEQIEIEIDRQLAADLQVNLADIAELLSTMLGSSNPASFTYEGQAYKVMLQIEQKEQRDIAILNKLYVQNAKGNMIPLASLISIHHNIGPDNLGHLNRMRSAHITAELTRNSHINTVIDNITSILNTQLPPDIQYRFTNSTSDYLEASGTSLYAFSLAILFIYLILALQFESFLDPFIVLFSVPLSIVGAIISLYLLNKNFSIYTNIAMITLIGLITKHGIMLTEFANQQQIAGKNKFMAILDAARIRLRPILMTTLTMVLGALPLALASGAGSESRQQLGIVIIGGMLIGTLFTLYVVPYAYLLISHTKANVAQPILENLEQVK